MKKLELGTAKGSLSTYARQIRGEPVCVTDHGKPVLVLVPVEDADFETVSLSFNPRFIALLQRSRAACRPGEGISTEQMRRRLAERRKAEGQQRKAS